MRQRYHEQSSAVPMLISIYNALINQYFKAVLSSSFPKQSDKNLNYMYNSFCFHDYHYSLFLCNIYSKPVNLFKILHSVNNQPVALHFVTSGSNTGEVSIPAYDQAGLKLSGHQSSFLLMYMYTVQLFMNLFNLDSHGEFTCGLVGTECCNLKTMVTVT
jgi:hypothetical protein